MYEMNYTCDEKNFSWYFPFAALCLIHFFAIFIFFLVALDVAAAARVKMMRKWNFLTLHAPTMTTNGTKNRDSLRWVMKFSDWMCTFKWKISSLILRPLSLSHSFLLSLLSRKLASSCFSCVQNLFMKIFLWYFCCWEENTYRCEIWAGVYGNQ